MIQMRQAAAFTFMFMLGALALGSAGCGPEKTESPKSVSTKPGDDRIRTKNGELIHGRLQGETFAFGSPALARLTLKRADLKEISFDGNRDTVETRGGDLLKGKLEQQVFRFEAKLGVVKEFRRADLKWIRFGS
ncbi:MAG: hypothetical protein HYY25_15440 [Candidatus Wallbacteria bacterium]|nr:hypothetical protein [Candidatus Wallbacteria bacterium]